MKELIQHLSNIPDAYDDFILGVICYAKKKLSRIDVLNEYMRKNNNLTTSDVIEFIMRQPDFYEDSAAGRLDRPPKVMESEKKSMKTYTDEIIRNGVIGVLKDVMKFGKLSKNDAIQIIMNRINVSEEEAKEILEKEVLNG